MEDIQLPSRDGIRLAATFFRPASPIGIAALINSGTGIPRQFYTAFARHLAARGIAVLSYDYRGIGGSEAPPDATMEAWGGLDQAAMIDHLMRFAPDAAPVLIGHSFGGQVLGLADNIGRVRAAVLIATQSGHWRHWKGRRRLRMWALWWLLIPGLTALTGRFPGRWIANADLPASVARGWARWGRSRHYVCDPRGRSLRPYNDRVRFSILWMSFSDDPAAPPAAVDSLLGYYPAATIERRHLEPADVGVAAIGHFGFFRKSMPRSAWDEIADWFVALAR